MKTLYRGYSIEVKREQALGGWDQIQYLVMRLKDGWFYQDGFHMGEYGTVRDVLNEMKGHVDLLLDFPNEIDDDDAPPELREERERKFWEEQDAEDDEGDELDD